MLASWHDLARVAGALAMDSDGRPSDALLVLDLDSAGPPPSTWSADLSSRVVVGVADADPPGPALPFLTCWVSPGEVDDVVRTVTTAPVAAVVLAQLLRGRPATPAIGLINESLAYSTLLAGHEFEEWLTSRTTSARESETDPVIIERSGDTLTITLNRPDRHNAYSASVRDALRDALDVAVADPSVHVVLRGNGASFCSGGDLAEFGMANDPAAAHLVRTVGGVGSALAALAGRTRAVVHGACIGAGIELAAFAGRVEAADETWFQLPELRMGLIPGAGGTVSIPARIGRWRTAQLALTGRPVDLPTALSWGLVDVRTT